MGQGFKVFSSSELSCKWPKVAETMTVAQIPLWLSIQPVDRSAAITLDVLDPGEQDAILLAEQQGAALVIIDDLLGRQVATDRGLKVTGLLGVLDAAARQNLVDFPSAIVRLRQTSFRASSTLIQSLLQKYQ